MNDVEPPKRFAVFGSPNYYPEGGWRDFLESFHTLEEAEKFAKRIVKDSSFIDWTEIVDLETGVML